MLISILYLGFSFVVKQHLLKVEKEKAELIVQTIEPLIAINAFLGLTEEIIQIASKTKESTNVLGIKIQLNNKVLVDDIGIDGDGSLVIREIISSPVSTSPVGIIEIRYITDAYKKAAEEINKNVLFLLGFIAIGLLAFGLLVRHFLRPLESIAREVSAYKPGKSFDFKNERVEPELLAITNAFNGMVKTIKDHNLLLERYKISIDESSIVSRIDVDGMITYVNDAFCNVSGYQRDELINASCNLVQDTGSTGILYNQIWDHVNTGEIWKGTITNRKKNGDSYYVKSTVVPMFDDNNEIIEFMTIQHDISEIVRQKAQITRQTKDADTGLDNRVKLLDDLKDKQSATLALFSIDNYHVIRNYYGYQTGMDLLIKVANELTELVDQDQCGLYKLASNEFALLSTQSISLDTFYDRCTSIVNKIEDTPVLINDEKFDIHMSVGISNTMDRLSLYASLALEQAIKQKVPAIIYETSGNLINQFENNIIWTKKIKEALNEKRIVVFAQAIVSATDLIATKYECLVRMIGDDGSIISPFHFLEVSKKTKLYHEITKTVISQAVEALVTLKDVTFSINLSPDDFLHEETIQYLKNKLTENNVANRLVLEIVESEEIENFDAITKGIFELKELGCKVAIDDFGTGYSNFSYLMELNADFIKVDGSLIKNIDHDKNSKIISSTILEFAKQLGLQTIAEFVHSESVQNEVQLLGFDYLQGFHLAEPVPLNEIINAE